MTMGLLMDIRSGKRGNASAGALVFWIVAGAALGFGASQLLPRVSSESWMYLWTVAGGLLGAAVGFYAEWGTSVLARTLPFPASSLTSSSKAKGSSEA
jgi:hypothetical protein